MLKSELMPEEFAFLRRSINLETAIRKVGREEGSVGAMCARAGAHFQNLTDRIPPLSALPTATSLSPERCAHSWGAPALPSHLRGLGRRRHHRAWVRLAHTGRVSPTCREPNLNQSSLLTNDAMSKPVETRRSGTERGTWLTECQKPYIHIHPPTYRRRT